MAHTLFVTAFKQACSVKGCPFCAMAQVDTRRYVGNLLYEYSLAPDIHLRMAKARGLCNTHSWLLQYIAHSQEHDGMGVAILYASVAKKLVDDLSGVLTNAPHKGGGPFGGSDRSAFGAQAAERIRANGACMVCEQQIEAESFSANQFWDHFSEFGPEGDLCQRYSDGAGACFPHLCLLLRHAPSDAAAEWLIRTAQEKLSRLISDLEVYVRKHDVQFKNLPVGPEKDSWVRAVEQLAGKRDIPVCVPKER